MKPRTRVPGVHLVIGVQGIGFGGGHYGLEPATHWLARLL
jgi:hypothetical protein